MTKPLDEKRIWAGTSPEGLNYEIAFWGEGSMCEGRGMWNYYVIIHEDQLRPDDWNKVWLPLEGHWLSYNGHKNPTYNEWSSLLSEGDFHGGITFYEKHQQVDGDSRWIKVGCDYGHLWDLERGFGYSLSEVQLDALNTCRKLSDILNPLVRCTWTGYYFDPRFDVSEDVPGWKGGFLSPGGLGSKTRKINLKGET